MPGRCPSEVGHEPDAIRIALHRAVLPTQTKTLTIIKHVIALAIVLLTTRFGALYKQRTPLDVKHVQYGVPKILQLAASGIVTF
jgi:hypothetical protein